MEILQSLKHPSIARNLINVIPSRSVLSGYEYGLAYVKTLKSFKKSMPVATHVDEYILEAMKLLAPSRLTYTVTRTRHRPTYNERSFAKNLALYASRRRPEPKDWKLFTDTHCSELDIPTVHTYNAETDFAKLDINWSAAAGYGYEGSKGNLSNFIRASRTAAVAIAQRQEGRILTFNEYTPDIAFSKPEPSETSKEKLRPIWSQAFHNWIIGALTHQPITHATPSDYDYPLICNIDPVIDIPKLYAHWDNKYPDYKFVQIDYSHYDCDSQTWETDADVRWTRRTVRTPNPYSQAHLTSIAIGRITAPLSPLGATNLPETVLLDREVPKPISVIADKATED